MLRLYNHTFRYASLLAVPALLLGPAFAAAPQKKPVERYTVSGTVTGLAPGARAVIKANKVYPKEIHTTSTRADGSYTLRGLTPGNYTVRPSHARHHFQPNFHSVAVRGADKDGIDFKAIPNAPKKR